MDTVPKLTSLRQSTDLAHRVRRSSMVGGGVDTRDWVHIAQRRKK